MSLLPDFRNNACRPRSPSPARARRPTGSRANENSAAAKPPLRSARRKRKGLGPKPFNICGSRRHALLPDQPRLFARGETADPRRPKLTAKNWNSGPCCDMRGPGRYAPPWGVETPSSGLASTDATPHSLTYGRGACGVCNRFSRTKGHRGRLERFPTPRSPRVGVGSFAGAHRTHALLRGGSVGTIA
jgi:hypothetical protein